MKHCNEPVQVSAFIDRKCFNAISKLAEQNGYKVAFLVRTGMYMVLGTTHEERLSAKRNYLAGK
jgi:hypothetical protein